MSVFAQSWPWYVAGPLLGLCVPVLLLLGNRQFGIAGGLRAMCAAVYPGKAEFLRYDWRGTGAWNLAFAAGIVLGGFLVARVSGIATPEISEATRGAIAALGIHDISGLAPREVFSWSALLSLRGFLAIMVGGFLVGFGSAWAGGCTSGHGVAGLASLQLPSLVAVAGFFAGGVFATFVLLPLIF